MENMIFSSGRQYGFRRGRSTRSAINYFINQCMDTFDEGKYVSGLSKAFD